MSIKGNNSSGLIAATSGDFTMLQNTSNGRWIVTSINAHDKLGAGDTVDFFVSDDAVTAAAERIDQLVVGANATDAASFVPVSLAPGKFLLGNAITGGGQLVVEAIYTTYDGDS